MIRKLHCTARLCPVYSTFQIFCAIPDTVYIPCTMASPEQGTLTRVNVQLVKCIQRAPKDVADGLKAFLSPEDERYLANDTHDQADKARRIISAVDSRLDLCVKDEKKRKAFFEFVEALRKTGPWTGDTVELLEEEYQAITGCAINRTSSEPFVSPSSSLESVPSRNASQNSRTSQPAPQLTVATLQKNISGLSDDKLNKSIEDAHLRSLAGFFDRIDGYIEKLQLPPGKQTDVRDKAFLKGTQIAMTDALKCWRSPNPFAATYRALLEILLDMKRGDVATHMAQYIAEKVQ